MCVLTVVVVISSTREKGGVTGCAMIVNCAGACQQTNIYIYICTYVCLFVLRQLWT